MEKLLKGVLDVEKRRSLTDFNFVQGDTDVYLLELTLLGLVLPVGTTATITWQRANNTVVVASAEKVNITDNVVTYSVDSDVYKVPGRVQATVEFYQGSKRITSPIFTAEVRAQLLQDEEAIPTENEYPLLTSLITENQTIQAEETIRIASEIERVANETNRQESIGTIETEWHNLTAGQQQDSEVIIARDGEPNLKARLDKRDASVNEQLAKKATIKTFVTMPTTSQLGDYATTNEIGLVMIGKLSVTSVSPNDGATNQYTFLGQGTITKISATLNESLDPTTVNDSNVTANGSLSGVIAGTVSYDDITNKIIFTPNSNFAFNETVTLTVGTGVKSADGVKNLPSAYTWSFTTFATKLDVTSVAWDVEYGGLTPISPWLAGGSGHTYITDTDSDYSQEAKNNNKARVYTAADVSSNSSILSEDLVLNQSTGVTYRARVKHNIGILGSSRCELSTGARRAWLLFGTSILDTGSSQFVVNMRKYRTMHIVADDAIIKFYLDDNPTPVLTRNTADATVTTVKKAYAGITTITTGEAEAFIDFVKVKNGKVESFI